MLEADDYLTGGENVPPSDLVDPRVWHGIMNLPDDVAIRISDHFGSRFKLLYELWGDWVGAVGDVEDQDELFSCMLDANDCFQCANFNFLHGFYRCAFANLRTALELVMIGTFGSRWPENSTYQHWKACSDVYFGFSHCRNQLRTAHSGDAIEWLFDKSAFPAVTYAELCKFTHARPDSSDGALWQSNGPVYNNNAIAKTFKLSLDVYATSYLLVKVGRPAFELPINSEILFELKWMAHHTDMLRAFRQLYTGTA